MKSRNSLFLALLCAWANVSVAGAQDAAPTSIEAGAVAPASMQSTAAQIIEKSRQTYAAFSSYQGSCSVVSDASIAMGDEAPTQNASSASATIEFERGKQLSVSGVDAGGQAYRAQWTPVQTWLEMARGRQEKGDAGKTEREIIPDEPNFSAVDALIASLTGVTSGTGSLLPAALQDGFWSNPFPVPNSHLQLLAPQNLGATSCYVVVATDDKLKSVNTYWIEQNTFLLRRLTEEQGEQIYDDMPAINGQKQPTMRLAYSLNQYVFATTKAK